MTSSPKYPQKPVIENNIFQYKIIFRPQNSDLIPKNNAIFLVKLKKGRINIMPWAWQIKNARNN